MVEMAAGFQIANKSMVLSMSPAGRQGNIYQGLPTESGLGQSSWLHCNSRIYTRTGNRPNRSSMIHSTHQTFFRHELEPDCPRLSMSDGL